MTPYDAENIEWDEGNEREFADHGLTLWQAEDVLRDMNFYARNKSDHAGEWMTVGRDRGGASVTVIFNYDSIRRSLRPVTGWESNVGEQTKYRKYL